MPYISKNDDRRKKLRYGEPALIAGELNYQIFYYIKHNKDTNDRIKHETIKVYVDNFLGSKPNYQRYNDMTGVLIRCGKEIKRRLNINGVLDILIRIMENYDNEIAKYEDIKSKENGDVE